MTIYILTGPRQNSELPVMIHGVTDDGDVVQAHMDTSSLYSFVSIPLPDFYRDRMDLIQCIGRAVITQ